jgi:hypothetical protein
VNDNGLASLSGTPCYSVNGGPIQPSEKLLPHLITGVHNAAVWQKKEIQSREQTPAPKNHNYVHRALLTHGASRPLGLHRPYLHKCQITSNQAQFLPEQFFFSLRGSTCYKVTFCPNGWHLSPPPPPVSSMNIYQSLIWAKSLGLRSIRQ